MSIFIVQKSCSHILKTSTALLTKIAASFLLIFSYTVSLQAQDCPPNIDFESGTFTNWTCYTGSVAAVGGQNVITLSPSGGPVTNQHTMFTAGQGNKYDPFGGFPVNCPNGSGHSIKLGNNSGGGQAEGISYEFTIPFGQNIYSLIYHYAVVFQDPNHQIFQQPRLEIEITNVTDNLLIDCSSFTFIPVGSLLPGFFVSPTQQDTTNVWCKDWSAVSINLNGNAGKTIRLFFKTADCTFTRHFGYAYIDVNSECSSEFLGANYCPDDTAIRVTAPFGYQNYTWYNSNFTQILGNQQSLNFSPPPPVGTTLAVVVLPFNGYGCIDTLHAQLIDTLTLRADAGKDALSCNQSPVKLGINPKPGIVYTWSPDIGLSNPDISNPFAGPLITTQYILTATNFGGGCKTTDTVLVTTSKIDTTRGFIGKALFCADSGDSAILTVRPTDSIQWFKDGVAIVGANNTRYKATQSGYYYAMLYNSLGCSITTNGTNVLIDKPVPGIIYPLQNAVINYPLQLQARKIGITAEWSPPTFLNNTTIFSPLFTGNKDKQYSIEIKSAAGCVTTDSQFVKVFKEVKFYVPTAFTPNNDGLNDYLKPIPVGIKDFKYFRIYNRWGQLIFDLKSNTRGWDGRINSKIQSTQTVVWMAEGIGIDNRIYIQKGTCILIR
jgi:gliding motility-associated-like protein